MHIPSLTPLVMTARAGLTTASDLPALADLPAILDGNPAIIARVIGRWKAAERDQQHPAMSMAAWNALGADGSVLDDESGRIVGRVDVGWFLERGRAMRPVAASPIAASMVVPAGSTEDAEEEVFAALPAERTQQVSGFVRRKDAPPAAPAAARAAGSR